MRKETVKVSRRDFVRRAATGLPLSAAFLSAEDKSFVRGVRLGVQTYSFHEILNDGGNHADAVIRDMLACGLYVCELFSPQIEPGIFTARLPAKAECAEPFKGCRPAGGGTLRNPWAWEFARLEGKQKDAARNQQRKWRETVSLDYFRAIRKKFNDAGIEIYAYNPIDVITECSDLELDRIFQMAKALGARAVNVSTTLTMLKRLISFAEKNGILVAPHGHSVTWDPEHFSTRATFEKALRLSKSVGINLDIGHYTAAGEDPVEFIKLHHDRITNLHLKDRQKNKSRNAEDGQNTVWGKGDTPIGPVLQLLKTERFPFPALIEYEYAGDSDPINEVRKCYEFCKKALA
jgi:sugar phosphate isomerase/epimerase